jgi:carbamoyl-phosphate synthase/aspartate carbamoyltransferase
MASSNGLVVNGGPTNGDTPSTPPSKVLQVGPHAPVTAPVSTQDKDSSKMVLEMQDGTLFEGFSFGADHSVAGECVFQTGELWTI